MGNELLLQLLVFEHGTGDVTVQTEVGQLLDIWHEHGGLVPLTAGTVCELGKRANIRELINKAVAGQFGRKPEPPYIKKVHHDTPVPFRIQYSCGDIGLLTIRDYNDLTAINGGKPLPVVDARESQPTSVWKQVFPPEPTDADNLSATQPYNWVCEQMAKETAFTVWRLTVTSQ